MCLRIERRPAGPAPVFRQFARQWLDGVEDGGDVSFVVRQDHAGGKRVGDQQRVLVGQAFQHDGAARQDLFVLVGRNLDSRRLLLAPLGRAGDPAGKLADNLVLLQRRHADQDRDAVAEQRDDAAVTGAKRQRLGRQHVVAFEPYGVDAVAEQQRAGRDAGSGWMGYIAHRHTLYILGPRTLRPATPAFDRRQPVTPARSAPACSRFRASCPTTAPSSPSAW